MGLYTIGSLVLSFLLNRLSSLPQLHKQRTYNSSGRTHATKIISQHDDDVIGKTALYEPQPFSEDSAILVYSIDLDYPVFTSLDFITVTFSFGHRPCVQPPVWETRSPYPQWEDDPVISPGTKVPFCHLLRLAGVRWGYSNLPPQERQHHATGIILDVLKETFGSRFLNMHGRHFEWATSFTSATLA
jgi:hypothetical protein